MRHALAAALSISILAGATSSVGHAQLTRTWVSGTGNDANSCARTAPCATFGSALSKTAANGEIDCLDSGSFGSVAINKSITIDCNGVVGGITASGADYGVFVNAGVNDVVILRNLEINGAGLASNGVWFESGKQLTIESTRISGFRILGVLIPAGAGEKNVVISNSTVSTTGDFGIGVYTSVGNTVVSHSVITGNGFGLLALETGVIDADSNVLAFNGVAVQAGGGGSGQGAAMVRLSNNDVYSNRTGFGCGGGVLASAGNNRKGSNVGGTVPTCAPTVAITQQ